MDIAALSVISNQAQLRQQASLSVLDMVMDTSTGQTQALLEMNAEMTRNMELSVNPNLGRNLDLLV